MAPEAQLYYVDAETAERLASIGVPVEPHGIVYAFMANPTAAWQLSRGIGFSDLEGRLDAPPPEVQFKRVITPQEVPWHEMPFSRRSLLKGVAGAASVWTLKRLAAIAAGSAAGAAGLGAVTNWFTNLPFSDQASSQSSYYQVFLQSGCQAGGDLSLGARIMVPEDATAPKGIKIGSDMYIKYTKIRPTRNNAFDIPDDTSILKLNPTPIMYDFSGTPTKPGADAIFASRTVAVFDGFDKIAEFRTEPLKQTPAELDSFTTYAHGIGRLVGRPTNDSANAPVDVSTTIYFSSKDLDWNNNRPPDIPYLLKSAGRTVKQGTTPGWQSNILFNGLNPTTRYELSVNEGKLPSFRVWFVPKNLFKLLASEE